MGSVTSPIEYLTSERDKWRKLAGEMAEAIKGLPVEEWVEQDPRDGSPVLIGYVMQAQGEWDKALAALTAFNTATGDSHE